MRSLSYYNQQRLTYRLLIADSGNSDHLNRKQRIVDYYKASLNIEHKTYEGDIEFNQKLSDVLKFVDTPYVVLGADDDFFVPRMLDRALAFLKTHPDYSIAHGEAVSFALEPCMAHGQIGDVSRYKQVTLDCKEAARRFYSHLTNYSGTWYSVQRTVQLRENWKKAAGLISEVFFPELLSSCLSVIQGKAKKLDGLYMVRQHRPENKYSGPDLFDWIAWPDWGSQYERLRNCIAEELARHEGISIDEGQRLVKKAFWFYLATGFNNQWRDCYPNNVRDSSLRDTLRRVPGLRRVWRMLKNTFGERSEPEISLAALSNKSSPYYEDFQPIYRAVTESPKELPNETPCLDKHSR